MSTRWIAAEKTGSHRTRDHGGLRGVALAHSLCRSGEAARHPQCDSTQHPHTPTQVALRTAEGGLPAVTHGVAPLGCVLGDLVVHKAPPVASVDAQQRCESWTLRQSVPVCAWQIPCPVNDARVLFSHIVSKLSRSLRK